MPIPSDVIRYALSGTAPGGEIFVTSLWTTGQAVASQGDANLVAETMASTLVTHKGTFTPLILADTAYTEVTAYCYPTGGPAAKYIGTAPVAGVVGNSTFGPLPLQVCAVVSLRTGFAGRSYRGRMYLPATGQPLEADHQMSNTDCQSLAQGYVSFLHDVDFNNAGKPVVVSTKLGTATPIASVVVDSRLDIQRRRANREAAAHTATQPVVYS